MILAIAARDLRLLFAAPIAWAILGVVQALLAYVFLARIEIFMQHQGRIAELEGAPGLTDVVVAPTFASAGIVMLLVAPVLTMRAIAEERRSGTLVLLLSSPVGMAEIVLGKFLALLGFLTLAACLVATMPLSLLAGAAIDLGQVAAGLLGLVLLLAAFCSIGLFVSSLTSQPAVAAVGAFGALLGLWIIDWGGDVAAGRGDTLFAYLSMMHHYEPLLQGRISSVDVAYFILLSAVFLTLTAWRLDSDRLFR